MTVNLSVSGTVYRNLTPNVVGTLQLNGFSGTETTDTCKTLSGQRSKKVIAERKKYAGNRKKAGHQRTNAARRRIET